MNKQLQNIVLSLFSVVCLVAAGYFGYQYLKARSVATIHSTQIPTPVPTVSPQIASVSANLVTYQNSGGDFSFEYPASWTIYSSTDSDIIFKTKENNDLRISVASDSSPTIAAYLVKADKISGTAYEGEPSIEVKSTKKTVINNLSCIQREEYLIAADLTQTTTYFKKGSTVVSLSLTPTYGNTLVEDKKLYNKLLTSFNFK